MNSQPEKKEKKPKEKGNKRRKKREERIKVLGVEPVTKRKALDQFGHLEDSDTNIQGQGFDDVLRYMKKMGVQISYQKETHGNNLKSNLKPRLNAKKRGLNVKFNLEGLVVKDENTSKKLKEKTKENFNKDGIDIEENGTAGNQEDALDKTMNNEGETSKVYSLDSSNIFSSQYMKKKKKKLKEKKEEDIPIDTVEGLQKMVVKKYATVKRVEKKDVDAEEIIDENSSPRKKRQQQVWKNLKAPIIKRDEESDEVNSKHNSDEEIINMRKIGKKKIQVVEKEKEKIAPLLEQQKITSDYTKFLEDKKEYFVEIPDKGNVRIANKLDFNVNDLVSNYNDLYKDKKEKPGAKKTNFDRSKKYIDKSQQD